jgi:hypothetical protein
MLCCCMAAICTLAEECDATMLPELLLPGTKKATDFTGSL